MTDVLRDLLQDSLQIVLCGTAAGTTSAAARAYYAHRQNKFWRILHETNLTPELLQPHQYRNLPQYRPGESGRRDGPRNASKIDGGGSPTSERFDCGVSSKISCIY